MNTLTALPEWHALGEHRKTMDTVHLRELFATDPERFDKFSLEVGDLFLDYSKNICTRTTLDLLEKLANSRNLSTAIEDLFTGKKINHSEDRPALHTALRNAEDSAYRDAIQTSFAKMADFSQQIFQGQWRGYTNKPITDIVIIGIGGSYLGPALVIDALNAYAISNLQFHFLTNIDATQILQLQKILPPETTLFIISSKSFTTQETLTNALNMQAWMQQQGCATQHLPKHFIAITAYPEKALAFGIAANNIFQLWDWVGGRYSLWSAIGLPIVLSIGLDNFQQLLDGAKAMDLHFRQSPILKNMPIILGLLSVWYHNFFQASAHAVLPYAQTLQRLPAYLQQLVMESNGKHVTRSGELINYTTSSVLFGEVGTNGQHSFYQLLHQGTHFIPADFIIPVQHHPAFDQHQALLFANALSQSKAFMDGNRAVESLQSYKLLSGNKPSNSILMPHLTPRALGSLLALYEHKTFVESVIWDINPFDQWGVERGKELTLAILPNLLHGQHPTQHDPSTDGLIKRYHQMQKRPR